MEAAVLRGRRCRFDYGKELACLAQATFVTIRVRYSFQSCNIQQDHSSAAVAVSGFSFATKHVLIVKGNTREDLWTMTPFEY